jgi:phospholipid-binding lipoprotein MlaA
MDSFRQEIFPGPAIVYSWIFPALRDREGPVMTNLMERRATVNENLFHRRMLPAALPLVAVLSGCAAIPPGGPDDSLQSVNRPLYKFNDAVDAAVLKPVSEAYSEHLPKGMRTAISNFYDNIQYLDTILNDFLQGKFRDGFHDFTRLAVNSTFGVLGLFDMATRAGLEKHDEDFGQTLGVWDATAGAYIVYPLLGPSSVRDTPGIVVSALTNLIYYADPAIGIPLTVLGVIDFRTRADNAMRFRNAAALDPYLFTRDAYLQHREFLIYDGNPPLPDYLEEMEGTGTPAEEQPILP